MKICNQCNKEKIVSEFYKAKGGLFGVAATCKTCKKEKQRVHYAENGHLNKTEYYEKNKDKIKKRNQTPQYKKMFKIRLFSFIQSPYLIPIE